MAIQLIGALSVLHMKNERCLTIRVEFFQAAEAWQVQVLSTYDSLLNALFEPPRGKTNNVVSDQVRHKPVCTVIENG